MLDSLRLQILLDRYSQWCYDHSGSGRSVQSRALTLKHWPVPLFSTPFSLFVPNANQMFYTALTSLHKAIVLEKTRVI